MRQVRPRPPAAPRTAAARPARSGVTGLILALLLIAAVTFGATACARDEPPPAGDPAMARIGEVSFDALPSEAQRALKLIQQGGPFPYRNDGAVFGNRERLLPRQPRGYYSEYTVTTPGRRDRGARRIVAGKGATGDPSTSGEYYYTEDHYRSFRRITQ